VDVREWTCLVPRDEPQGGSSVLHFLAFRYSKKGVDAAGIAHAVVKRASKCLNLLNKRGMTAMAVASSVGAADVVDALAAAGADPNVVCLDKNGRSATAWDFAVQCAQQKRILTTLEACGGCPFRSIK